VALLADTHGSVDGRIADLVRACDCAVHAGDIGGRSVLAALQPLGGSVFAVRGNNDTPAKWAPGEHAALSRIAVSREIALPGGILVVVHGHQIRPAQARHGKLRARYHRARAVLYGHTHRRVCDLAAEPWILNPGAAGRSRTFGGPSCLVLVVSGTAWSVTEHVYPR
jgi:putative phosphoesterase